MTLQHPQDGSSKEGWSMNQENAAVAMVRHHRLALSRWAIARRCGLEVRQADCRWSNRRAAGDGVLGVTWCWSLTECGGHGEVVVVQGREGNTLPTRLTRQTMAMGCHQASSDDGGHRLSERAVLG